MSPPRIALLPNRGLVSVSGADARKLLQGLVTNDMDKLQRPGDALHAGLLTPQGKILFAFFVVQTGDGFLLETEADQSAALAKRLAFYKLRAAVAIADVSVQFAVAVAWAASPSGHRTNAGDEIVVIDPRHASIGWRMIAPAGTRIDATEPIAAYHAHRIALGVPEPQLDYPLGDTYPHEADFDTFHGADFDKGCFVGQEVVARMQHKTVVRKRVVRVAASSPLPADHPAVTVGPAEIGRLGSVAGEQGLALLRLDRAIEAIEKGQLVTAHDIALEIDAEALNAYRSATAPGGPTP